MSHQLQRRGETLFALRRSLLILESQSQVFDVSAEVGHTTLHISTIGR